MNNAVAAVVGQDRVVVTVANRILPTECDNVVAVCREDEELNVWDAEVAGDREATETTGGIFSGR